MNQHLRKLAAGETIAAGDICCRAWFVTGSEGAKVEVGDNYLRPVNYAEREGWVKVTKERKPTKDECIKDYRGEYWVLAVVGEKPPTLLALDKVVFTNDPVYFLPIPQFVPPVPTMDEFIREKERTGHSGGSHIYFKWGQEYERLYGQNKENR